MSSILQYPQIEQATLVFADPIYRDILKEVSSLPVETLIMHSGRIKGRNIIIEQSEIFPREYTKNVDREGVEIEAGSYLKYVKNVESKGLLFIGDEHMHTFSCQMSPTDESFYEYYTQNLNHPVLHIIRRKSDHKTRFYVASEKRAFFGSELYSIESVDVNIKG